MSANSPPWQAIFDYYKIHDHDFDESPFPISAKEIQKACEEFFGKSSKTEARILCKQDSREDRPDVFKEKGLFILPTINKYYNIIKGEGYIDIENIESEVKEYSAKLDFELVTSKIGDSEMQYLDYAYAASLIRSFVNDDSLIQTIRGRKFTPEFKFEVNGHLMNSKGVQTEIDAGYEGKEQVVLVEAKNNLKENKKNIIIRQLYYPYLQWGHHSKKKVISLLFTKEGKGENVIYSIRQYEFDRANNKKISDYNSIELVRAEKFRIID